MRNVNEFIIHYRSFIGILCLIAVLVLATPSNLSIPLGFFLVLIGMFFRAWAAGYINKDRELATEGPYALTRNPLYFANFILGAGIAVAGNNLYGYIIFLVYYGFFFTYLITVERRRLRERFGQRYDEWARQANLFFPRLRRVSCANFNIAYYMKNKEYRVLFFSLFVMAVLIAKFLLRIQ